MFCELKQTVLLLEQEFTPVEIRIGRGNPSWVVETGTPVFDSVAKLELEVGMCDLGFGSRVI